MSPQVFSPEKRQFVDPETGRQVIQWTNSVARDNHLYFTSPSVTADDRWLVFLSERLGGVNLFAIARPDGEIRQLSRNRHGTQRSYCWPAGGWYGLSKASPVLDPVRNRLFYIQDEAVWRVDLDAEQPEPQRIWQHPVGWWSAFNHVSPDGKTLCIPLAHPRGFPEGLEHQRQQLRLVPQIMAEIGVGSLIYLVDVDSGAARVAAEVPFWVSHVQFDPTGSGRIIFNQEGTRVYHHSRTWCLETDGQFRPLYAEPENEHDNHENWAADGQMIVYHGARDGIHLMAGRRWDGSLVFEWQFPEARIGHTTPTIDSRGFLTDGGDYVSLYRRSQADQVEHVPLCRHDAQAGPWLDQDDHVHPLVAPHGHSVVFASNRDGVANVYETAIDDLLAG